MFFYSVYDTAIRDLVKFSRPEFLERAWRYDRYHDTGVMIQNITINCDTITKEI